MRNVLILGSGRSGTSLVAGTLSQAGYFFGGEPYPARAANPKGFFETAEVNGTNEVLLASALPRHPRYRAGQRWLATLPENAKIESTSAVEDRIARLVAHTPFCFKDPRFCHTLPVWRPHVGDAAFLCVFRDPAVTAASILKECAEEPYLAGLDMSFERALDVWTSMYAQVLRTHSAEGDWHFFHYDQVLEERGLARIERATGAQVARDFPDARLSRSTSARAVPNAVRDLYAELCDRAEWRPGEKVRVAVPRGQQATSPVDLSVILCTYNRREILARSLASFEAQSATGATFEVVVVDDGSTDGTAAMLDAWQPGVTAQVIHRANGGLAAARNTGIAAARGRILLFVNDDTIAFEGLVSEHLRIHASLGRPMAVLGTFEQPAAVLDNALMRFLEGANLVFHYAEMQNGETYDYQHFWTCNVSVPAELVRTAGGFDESFRHYGCEDIDLGFRLERLGCRVLFDARARAEHDHVLDLAALEKRTRFVAKAFVRLFEKHPACLEHPSWQWIREHTIESLDAEVGRRLGRAPALYAAAAELATTDLGALEDRDAGIDGLAPAILAALESTVRELSTAWYFDGFAAGLRDLGKSSFGEMRARPSGAAASLAAASVGATDHGDARKVQARAMPTGTPSADANDAGTARASSAPAASAAHADPNSVSTAHASTSFVAAPPVDAVHANAKLSLDADAARPVATPTSTRTESASARVTIPATSPSPALDVDEADEVSVVRDEHSESTAGSLHDLDEHALRLLDGLCQMTDTDASADGDLARIRTTAAEGEIDLATVEAIRIGAALDRGPATDPAASRVLVDLLNDLGVLRFRAADPAGSLALIGHALALDPRHALAAKNKADIAGASAKQPKRWADGPDAKAQPTSLNAWTREALDLAQKEIGFTGKDILEVGGAIPPEAARATGARKWSACYLEAKPHAEPGYELAPADARRLPWSDASFDAVFSSCAFEHIQDLGTALGEMWRVLRPGGAIVTLFAPIWSYAVGHHLWETDARGERIMFLDPVIPRFGHLLLTEAELGWYLRIVLGETSAQRCTHYVYHHPCINRLFEGDFRRLFERSGFDASHLARQPVWAQEHVPSDRLNAELVRLHPAGGDFGTPGFRGVLTKVMPDARRRRTIESSQRTSTRAPSVPGR